MDWMTAVSLLAEEEQKNGALPFADLIQFSPFILIIIVFYFLLIRPQRREQATRESMLAALKKNDKVVTIGGIIGTIANISADGQEVTLKVEDNTRLRVVRSSVQRVLAVSGESESPSENKT
ncbi:MAG: preprotein translocase subunit YajC [Planctomycetales bacterium]